MSNAARRLHELIDFVFDGSCTDDEREEFATLIDNHPELIQGLAEEVFIHSLLQWQSESISRDLALIGKAPQEVQHAESADKVGQRTYWLAIWAVAASVLLGTAMLFWQNGKDRDWSELAVAELVDVENVTWANETTALRPRSKIVPGRLLTEGGEFTMKFRSGPVVRVIGAVSMMVENDMLVHLDRGQATARVPTELKGFTIKTPVIDVIDQGTEFGVATRENGFTDVVVFDGKVDLADKISNEHKPTRLIQGEAARVDRLGALQRIMQVGRNQRGSWWTADYPGSDINVIQEVSDNIPPADGSQYFCYQISYHGLSDDVFAYADHPHQWNGLTKEGLPEFLRGADYVKTFNDYRYMNDFQMKVKLARPANLYIFFDDRVPPPKWLTEQFEDTGVDIGLDEGPWGPGERAMRPDLPEFENGVGGGVSIDNIFSVWHRRCFDAMPIDLGLMGEETQARAMYGIVATPLEAKAPPSPISLQN